MKRITGSYDITIGGGEKVAAFVPFPLPPTAPPLQMDEELERLHARAKEAVHRLEIAGEMIPSLNWFVYSFVRKEAVISSQIEGTQATLIDLLNFEADDEHPSEHADIQDICNYLDALFFARKQLQSDKGLPLSMRLLNETHHRLMQGVRGKNKQPGEIRRSQNWIGDTRPGNATFVPPPVHRLSDILSAFEKYIHTEDPLPPLIRIGLLHVQFETIHPYLDGNGRIGRLLITLLFEHWKLLSAPLLYLSLFFKRHRDEYYRRLIAVRTEGDFEGWTQYFLEAVATVAMEAATNARELFALVSRDRTKVLAASESSIMAIRLFEQLPNHPVLSIATAMKLLDTTRPTATKAVMALLKTKILKEITNKKRDRTFGYNEYLNLLTQGTEL